MTTKDPAPTISELPELPPMTEWKYRTVGYTAAQMRAYVFADRAARRSTEGWQPIETAPKDGRTLLLGLLNPAGKWRTMRGQWMSADYIAEYWEYPENGDEGWFETCVEADDPPNCWSIDPTHWQLLPPAPTGAAEEKGQE